MPTNKLKNKRVIVILLILLVAFYGFYVFGRSIWWPIYVEVVGLRTLETVLKESTLKTAGTLKPLFEKSGLPYPPKKLALLGFKKEKRLELWTEKKEKWIFVTQFDIKAASGKAGPKLLEGDKQVPEGVYRIIGLNPNSRFHLSMKINYPNEFDLAHAKLDGRRNVGGDIFIHGKAVSIGCLAMGDEVAEQLFTLVSLVGTKNVKVIIAPNDFRRKGVNTEMTPKPQWLPDLYANIDKELKPFFHN